MEQHSLATIPPQNDLGCLTCTAIQKKRCPGCPTDDAPCDECARLHLECLPGPTGHIDDTPFSSDFENIVRCRDEIEKWSSSSLTKSEKGILLLSNILGISSPGNAILPKFVLSRQHHDEPSNQLAPASCESFLVNPTLHIIADPAHTTVLSDSGLSGNTFSHGVRSAGAKFNRHSSDSDVNRDGDDTPPNRTTSSLQPETYHNIDAPVGFILPVMSFLLTSYLPQVREVVFEVKDDEDKEAFKSAVAREAAKLAGNLGFRVEN